MTANVPQLSNEELVRAVYAFAVDLMKQGQSNLQVEDALVAKGLDSETASVIVNKLSRVRSQVMRRVALRAMGVGAAVCIAGILITFISYREASSTSGGGYVVAWGAVIFGAIQFFRGWWHYRRAR